MNSKDQIRPLSEKEIENSILEFLKYKGIISWKNNTTGIYDPNGKRFRSKSKYDRNGVSDILGILPDGRFLAIEVKRSSQARTRPSQRLFIEDINNNGGLAFVAFSMDCVVNNLKEYLKIQ